jgi:hypothetical protein
MASVVLLDKEGRRGGVTVRHDRDRSRVIVSCRGHLAMECAGPSIEMFLSALGRSRGELIGDLRQLASYDTECRVAWQRAMGSVRHQLTAIRFVGVRSPLIRTGILTASLLLRIDLAIVDHIEDLDE